LELQIVAKHDTMSGTSGLKTRKPRHEWFSFLRGCVWALIFMELLLHNFAGKYEYNSGYEQRSYREGIAWSHFSSDGLRLTGNVQIAGAPDVLIMGDSHVEAYQVPDKETMGSVLERQLRAEGKSWNVLQYAWSGADGPDYVYAAPLVLDRYHPKRIFLVMNAGDFESPASEDVRLVERNGEVKAEAVIPGAVRGRPPSFGGARSRKLKESGLLYASAVRFSLDILPLLTEHKASAQERDLAATMASPKNVDLIVRGLKEAYGDRLFILYTPGQPFSAQEPAEPQEARLLEDCQAEGMECRSLRERMIEALLERHELARGFLNSAPGVGHLNVYGHQLAADEMYERLN
jgi:hypothetical protein